MDGDEKNVGGDDVAGDKVVEEDGSSSEVGAGDKLNEADGATDDGPEPEPEDVPSE